MDIRSILGRFVTLAPGGYRIHSLSAKRYTFWIDTELEKQGAHVWLEAVSGKLISVNKEPFRKR